MLVKSTADVVSYAVYKLNGFSGDINPFLRYSSSVLLRQDNENIIIITPVPSKMAGKDKIYILGIWTHLGVEVVPSSIRSFPRWDSSGSLTPHGEVFDSLLREHALTSTISEAMGDVCVVNYDPINHSLQCNGENVFKWNKDGGITQLSDDTFTSVIVRSLLPDVRVTLPDGQAVGPFSRGVENV